VAGQSARGARGAPRRGYGQHFLRSPRVAASIVEGAGVRADELVVEIGAGSGRLTAPLAERAAEVVAVELDPVWATGLRERFRGRRNVRVLEEDALVVPLPRKPFRVVANVPFHLTTAILRRFLDDPAVPLTRADVIVEWEVACKRARCWPSTLVNVVWGARFEFSAARRLPAACFEPKPQVDAGLLRIVRRTEPLVDAGEYPRFRALVEVGFRHQGSGLRSALEPFLAPRHFKSVARDLGLGPAVAARDLDVHQWIAVFGAVRALR
jgi:23S rRNA (adenine-N6)-dimethyltransferase